MRSLIRSLLTVIALVASCTASTPAFAQDAPAPSGFASVEVAAQATRPVPDAPAQAPTAPAELPAIAEADARDPRERLVDEWFATHFHGLGPHLTEYLHGRLLVAVAELKALLLELPLS